MQMRRFNLKRSELFLTKTISNFFKDVNGYPLKGHLYKIIHNIHNCHAHFVIEVQQSIFKKGYPTHSNKLLVTTNNNHGYWWSNQINLYSANCRSCHGQLVCSRPDNALLLFLSKPNRNGNLCDKQKHLDLLMPLSQIGLPQDTLWQISQQQCEPPQLCHQTSSKTL